MPSCSFLLGEAAVATDPEPRIAVAGRGIGWNPTRD